MLHLKPSIHLETKRSHYFIVHIKWDGLLTICSFSPPQIVCSKAQVRYHQQQGIPSEIAATLNIKGLKNTHRLWTSTFASPNLS